jgi:hypothetical protein
VLRTRIATAFASTALLALGWAPGALADSGVTVDHDSPSAKEYAVPLDQARQDASGSGSSQTFGEGVGDQPARTTATTSATPAATPAHKTKKKHKRHQKSAAAPSSTTTTTTTPATTTRLSRSAATVPVASDGDGGTSSTVVLAGGGGIVALVGVATALWVRRRPGASR